MLYCIYVDPCELSKDIGNCRDLQTKVYYDVTKQQCLAFVYTGCGGNINNFNNFVDCSTKCGMHVQRFFEAKSISMYRLPQQWYSTSMYNESLYNCILL